MEDRVDLESVGEMLYNQIYPKHKENAGKLTGMLLELPGSVLSQMLQDESMLSAAVEKAITALQLPLEPDTVKSKGGEDVSVSSDSLGDQLFELVDVHSTGHSQKITGMLLEQHKDAVLKLLSDPKLLEEQINLALKTLKEQSEEVDISDASDADDKDKLGEELFSLVEDIDPLRANDITGMLLEMEAHTLRQLVSDHRMLEVAVQKAQAALDARQ